MDGVTEENGGGGMVGVRWKMLRQRPLASLCLAYLAGSVFYVLALDPRLSLLSGPLLRGQLILGVCWLVWLWTLSRTPGRNNRSPVALITLLLTFISAIGISALRSALSPDDVSRFSSAHLVTVEGWAVSEPRTLPQGTVQVMECTRLQRGESWRVVSGRCELFVKRSFQPLAGGGPLQWPEPGQSLEVTGVVQPVVAGSSPSADNLLRDNIHATLRVGGGGVLRPGRALPFSFASLCLHARNWLLQGLKGQLHPKEYDALAGMMFHQKDAISPAVLDDLQDTGTVHIVATAGLHVGIFVASCLLLLTRLLPQRSAVALTMVLAAGYCVACGGWPAVARATLAAELCLLARLLGRLPDAFTCLAIAAASAVILNPREIRDPGYVMSFIVVGTALLMVPLLAGKPREHTTGWLRRTFHHARSLAALSFAAQVGSLALTASYFGVISWIGLVANVLIVPLLMLILPLGLLTGILAHVSPALAGFPGFLLQELVHLLLWIAHRLALIPYSWRYVDPLPWQPVVGYYLALGLVLGSLRLMLDRRKQMAARTS